MNLPTPQPDPSYRIDAASRAHIKSGVDVSALEELLQCFPPESREFHLAMFLDTPLQAHSEGRLPGVTILKRISNSVMHDLLERARGWREKPEA
jgi:hypothetical protein